MNASDEEEMMNGAIAGPSNPSSAAPNATEAPQQGMSKNHLESVASSDKLVREVRALKRL
jgi:hypothetical protein